MPVNAGPSQGFWGRMGQQLPGMINAVGSSMPGPFGNTSRISGAITRGRTNNRGINAPGNQTTQQNGPGGMNPTGPSPAANQAGIVRGPSKPFDNINFGGPSGMIPGPGGMPMPRTGGITGGMFPGGGGTIGGLPSGPIMRPQPMPIGGIRQPQPMPVGGGLWDMYGQLSGEMGGPDRRQMFY